MRIRQSLIHMLLFGAALTSVAFADSNQAQGRGKAKVEKIRDDRDDARERWRDGGDRDNNNSQTRFRGMDRNRDGRISRDEWRGNDNSFAKHDANGDGIISGDEVKAGGRRDRDRDKRRNPENVFRNLDSNNDGVIARGEWRGRNKAFDRLDRNRDGVLSQDELPRRKTD